MNFVNKVRSRFDFRQPDRRIDRGVLQESLAFTLGQDRQLTRIVPACPHESVKEHALQFVERRSRKADIE